MRKSKFLQVIATMLVVGMILTSIPTTVLASEEVATTSTFVSETHDVFKSTESTLAPGVTQKINYAYSKDGKQMVYYVATADIARDDVVVQTSYYKQYENGAMGMAKLTDQMTYAKEKYSNPEDEHFISEYYTPVAGVNASFYNMSTGQPLGLTYIDGVSFGTTDYDNFFAILQDGTAVIDYRTNEGNYTGEKSIKHAVAGSAWLVRDGQDVTANVSGSYNTDRHSRACVGITVDGKVVFMQLDGRQEPFSCGGTFHELAQIMLEQGCVAAINLDGGGSATYASRPEGSEEVEVINRPSDGSERAISAGLIIASTVAPSNIFDHVNITADNDYVTPNSTVNLSAVGVSTTNASAEIPEGTTWQLADNKYGTIENGVFVSNGTTGDVTIEMCYEGKVIGSTVVHVVVPEVEFKNKTMTVPYNKKFKLEITVTTNNGKNKVAFTESDFEIELSDPKMGLVDGLYYTSCGENSGLTGGTVTVKSVYDETKNATANILFGRSSDIVEDFEEGDITGWSAGTKYGGSFGRFEVASVELVDKTNGKVRNGNHALALVADFTETTASGYKAVKYTFPEIDLSEATQFGMWMYLPVEDVHNLEFDIGGYEYYIEKDKDVNETGWYYITAPVSSVGKSLSSFAIYMTDSNEKYFNVFNEFKIYIDDLTVDYSDATEDRENPYFESVKLVNGLDSSEDMNGQTITNNTFIVKATAKENMNGNYTGLDISTAKVYVDGDELSPSQYTCDEKGEITVKDITLSDGTHKFQFSISDKNGNTGFISRSIVLNKENGNVSLNRRNSKALPLAGSVEYFDIVAEKTEDITAVSMDIDLDMLSTWELQGAEVLYGFEMEYSVDATTNTAHVTLNKKLDVSIEGKTVLASLPVRIWQTSTYLNQKYIEAGVVTNTPTANENSTVATPYVMWQTDRTRLIRLELDVLEAFVTYADGEKETFSAKPVSIITEYNRYRTAGYYDESGNYLKGDTEFCKQGKESTHIHTTIALDDKSSTCIENGYTGRTYCEECKSVIQWGTSYSATGHIYKVVEGVIKCECGDLFNGTWEDGNKYVSGVLADGWINDSYYKGGSAVTGICKVTAPDSSEEYYYDFGENGIVQGKYSGLLNENKNLYNIVQGKKVSGWYENEKKEILYFDKENFAAVTGEQVISHISYTFDEKGILIAGSWVPYRQSKTYYWAGNKTVFTIKEIDGKWYYFDRYGAIDKGLVRFEVGGSNSHVYELFMFGDDYVRIEEGLATVDGITTYSHEGVCIYAGLVRDADGNYYYINSSKVAVKNCSYGVTKTNGLLSAGVYEFDVDGKMKNVPSIVTQEGLVTESNGDVVYYENGELVYKGLVCDADGNYYYINSSKKAVKNCSYGVTKTNGLLPAGIYEFDAEGKIII